MSAIEASSSVQAVVNRQEVDGQLDRNTGWLGKYLVKIITDSGSWVWNLFAASSLESRHQDLVIPKVIDIQKNSWSPFLKPNELSICRIKEHLIQMNPGYIVSVGTERSLFDLILSPKEKCKGLIVLDVNPQVKVYLDFVVCLLRISKDQFEFCKLSNFYEGFHDINDTETLSKKIKSSKMPQYMKNYYLDNLATFARIYFGTSNSWAHNPKFEAANYFRFRKHFECLQSFAKSGNIMVAIESINNVFQRFKDEQISILDVSNVYQYEPIVFQGFNPVSPPRCIWTHVSWEKTSYGSFVVGHDPLPSDEFSVSN